MSKNRISKALNWLVTIGIILTFLMLLSIPLITTASLKGSEYASNKYLVLTITSCIYICSIPYIIALFNLKKLCKLVVNNNSFSLKVPKSIKTISKCAFIEVLLFNGSTIFLYFSQDFYLYAATIVPMILVTFISISIGFLSLVLAMLFENAIKIKDENDWTI